MPNGQRRQRCDPFVVVVEGADVVEGFAAGTQESLARFHVDFFERFEAVGDEAGADDVDAGDAFLASFTRVGSV